jgi:Sulfotransferase family
MNEKFGRQPGFMRQVLVHYHIYKNAGTSVDQILSDSFGEKWASFEGAPEKSVLSNSDVAAFADANQNICAISSHKARPFPAVKGFFPILFLRHPIDRARSMYNFARRDPAQVDHAVARDCSFNGYVKYWLDSPGSVLRNYQVAHLSQASVRAPGLWRAAPRPDDFQEACDYLRSLPFFGLVRRFKESCRGFEACLGRTFPALKMRPVHANASSNGALSETAALQAARDELGEATYLKLVGANEFDLALYYIAVELFEGFGENFQARRSIGSNITLGAHA